VVEADVLGRVLLRGEDPRFALGAAHRLFVGAVGVLQRDLPVLGAVSDEKRHVDMLDDAVQVHVVGEGDE
jgi:hypothetical protein